MADKVVRVEDAPGFFGQLKASFKGILTGLFMLVVAFPLVFWNECNSVEVADSLEEGAGMVVSVDSAKVDNAQDGKLVHTSGQADSSETITDGTLGVSVAALRLKRSVEMYQWKESKTEETKGDKKVTTYEYSKDWSGSVINSSSFEEKKGHTNPSAMAIEDKTTNAKTVTVGAYTLNAGQIEQINNWSDHGATEADAQKAGLKVSGGSFYKGTNPSEPQVGDLRIEMEVVKPGPVSLVAQQSGSSFQPFTTSNGRDISLLTTGSSTAEEMFEASQSANAMMTWVMRLVAFLFMFAGLRAVLGPLAVIGDRIPLVGGILTGALTLFCFLLAVVLWFFSVALAWLTARPLLGIALLVVGFVALVGIVVLAIKFKNSVSEAAA